MVIQRIANPSPRITVQRFESSTLRQQKKAPVKRCFFYWQSKRTTALECKLITDNLGCPNSLTFSKDVTDKNNRSNGCFCLAIYAPPRHSQLIKKAPVKGCFFIGKARGLRLWNVNSLRTIYIVLIR